MRYWGRIITAITALVFLCIGTVCLFDSISKSKLINANRSSEPINIPIDISKPGLFTGFFEQKNTYAHGEIIRIKASTPFSSKADIFKKLKGLKGKLLIKDKNGDRILDIDLKEDSFSGLRDPFVEKFGLDPIIWIVPFKNGSYELTLKIEEGAPAMKGIEHRLTAYYEFCGMENIVAVIPLMISFICFAVFFLLSATILAITMVKRKRLRKASS